MSDFLLGVTAPQCPTAHQLNLVPVESIHVKQVGSTAFLAVLSLNLS